MSIAVPGSNSRGPILGDDSAGAGLFENLSLANVDRTRSSYKVYVEDFTSSMATGDLALSRGTVTTVGAVAANTDTVSQGTPYLLLNAGTAANTGYNVQLNATASNTATTPPINSFHVLGMSAAGTNNREVILWMRFGISSNAVTWDGAALLGLFVSDTSLLDPTTGVPTIASAGGVGFHISQGGTISYVVGTGAITAVGTTIGTVGAMIGTVLGFKWYECGIRARQVSTTTVGRLKLYFGPAGSMVQVANLSQPLALNSGGSISWSILNGATNQSDLAIESMVSAVTRTPHLTDAEI